MAFLSPSQMVGRWSLNPSFGSSVREYGGRTRNLSVYGSLRGSIGAIFLTSISWRLSDSGGCRELAKHWLNLNHLKTLPVMFRFFCTRLVLSKTVTLFDTETQLGVRLFDSSLVIRTFSSRSSPNSKENTFTVSYLIKSCGLTPESAQSASKKIKFESPEKPDLVLSFLRDQGFVNAVISRLVKKQPQLLLANPKRTILPKLEFLRSKGVSRSDLPRFVTLNPFLLNRSLKKYLVPCYDILKSVLLSDNKVNRALKRASRITLRDLQKNFTVNVSVLRELGMPQSVISAFVIAAARLACQNSDKFNEVVNKVIEMGFDPAKFTFATALEVNLAISSTTWEHKMDVYRRWDLSDDEILSAFKIHPILMLLSEKKIMHTMDFFVNKMGLPPALVARVPVVLFYNLEKRTVPRCSVLRVLILKGLIKGEVPLASVMICREEKFLDKFVKKYQYQVPELLDIYQGKKGLVELGFDFDGKSGLGL